MTVQECYEAIGGDYNDIMSRLKTEERVKKFAGMFLKEKCYQTLVQTIEEGNQEEAFRAAHTLKGVCQNMSFTTLFHSRIFARQQYGRGKDAFRASYKGL